MSKVNRDEEEAATINGCKCGWAQNGQGRELGEPERMQVSKTCRCNADDAMAICNTQAKDKATTRNNWKTTGASVSGRYNTPPLQEDLVPRSRMAPEGNGRGRGRGKTKLLLLPMSETKEPCKVKQFREKNTTKMNEVENTPVGNGRQ